MAFVTNQTNCSGAGGCATVTVTSVGTAYTLTVDLTAASGLRCTRSGAHLTLSRAFPPARFFVSRKQAPLDVKSMLRLAPRMLALL
jgi:hypothetical protein